MCTVSFVPLNQDEFILTSNRDETTARGLSSAPQIIRSQNFSIACPVDPLANGTWIGASDTRKVVCLLNGAFKKHKRHVPYRKSRGLVVLDFFNSSTVIEYVNEYDFTNIEAFTMVIISAEEGIKLYELRWDGNQKYFTRRDEGQIHLWSSVTLYTEDIIAAKENAFKNYLKKSSVVSQKKLIDLHEKHFLYQDWVEPYLQLNEIQTLSVTSIHGNNHSLVMAYRDLIKKVTALKIINLPYLHEEKNAAS
ncbi:MAG: NRDE family protein [Chitinophagales bacterium]|nr:NRDE family protein [Chitinophagales bacterium]